MVTFSTMSMEEENKELMKNLDNAWNSQDWDTFNERHADNVAVFWPGQADPSKMVQNHREESIQFFKMFPDNNLINNPYKILFAEDDYTCSVADFTGTFKSPMKGIDGNMIQPTNKKFHLEFSYDCPLEEWKNSRREVVL